MEGGFCGYSEAINEWYSFIVGINQKLLNLVIFFILNICFLQKNQNLCFLLPI